MTTIKISKFQQVFLKFFNYRSFTHNNKFLFVGALFYACILMITSCSVFKQISRQASNTLLQNTSISTGFIGVSIYEPATNQFWYDHNATSYFVPASNTKLFSLYAGMKYLGDSLPAINYQVDKDANLLIQPTGDPTFLHPEFKSDALLKFFSNYKTITLINPTFTDNFLGSGWAWDDYKESYMPQRSNFPIYGNLINIKKSGNELTFFPARQKYLLSPLANLQQGFNVDKKWDDNLITINSGLHQQLFVPFTPNTADIIAMLSDTLHLNIVSGSDKITPYKNVIYSQPTDSLFKPMMHRSDNFYAEQTLLMVSNQRLGYMNTGDIIDTLLKSDLKDIPQKPKWVDGCGLSRYNLFTPQSFIYILNKMKNEFGLDRLKNILPTGGEGTLAAYFKKDAGFIYAKTGTLSNHCALSGFIITKKNKLLIFSVLVNNYQSGAAPVRKAVETFLLNIRKKY